MTLGKGMLRIKGKLQECISSGLSYKTIIYNNGRIDLLFSEDQFISGTQSDIVFQLRDIITLAVSVEPDPRLSGEDFNAIVVHTNEAIKCLENIKEIV